MIPADADVEYLKEHYAFQILDLGKTLLKVDDRMRWVRVHRFSVECNGRKMVRFVEIADAKFGPEVFAAQSALMVNVLKVEILKHEEGAKNG